MAFACFAPDENRLSYTISQIERKFHGIIVFFPCLTKPRLLLKDKIGLRDVVRDI